ncbi:hypothetical protein TNCV_1105101 [Trichonephila clavipes]|nr:hypothetical protein TNCV_1105101 [Trichonephila clavipes]
MKRFLTLRQSKPTDFPHPMWYDLDLEDGLFRNSATCLGGWAFQEQCNLPWWMGFSGTVQLALVDGLFRNSATTVQ